MSEEEEKKKGLGFRIYLLIILLILAVIVISPWGGSNIQKGLDLDGGIRVFLQPVGDSTPTSGEIQELIDVLRNRLNVYGLKDLKIRSAESDDVTYILMEVAGISRETVEGFVSQQGIFEARIANQTVFSSEHGSRDIVNVCRDDGTCSGVTSCGNNEFETTCGFSFSIKLSPEAAKRHGGITKDIDVVLSEHGNSILSERIEFYLDGSLIDSLNVDASLRGSETTDILISGSGIGNGEGDAIKDAEDNMRELQTVLITGSLPYKLDIVDINVVNPLFGDSFVRDAFIVALAAGFSVMLVVYIRYRNVKVLLPMFITLFSEIVLILGFAAAIGWSLDLVAIAGIIASVGTGIDDQIVITDEVLRGKKEIYFNWTDRIKKAFFIIMVAFFSTFAAMIPLWGAAGGLLRGFAVTTIVGITIGVLVTRPAFASILQKLIK